MNNFKKRGGGGGFDKSRSNFGGRPKFGGDRKGSGRDRDDRPSQKFSATCAACHKKCEVPFRPSGDKPVYCSDCFGKKNQDGHRDGRSGDRAERRQERSDYTKLPRDQRPPRHDKPRGQDDDGLGDIKRQLATIESRLNRILDVLNPPTKPERKVEQSTKVDKKAIREKKVVDKPALKEALDQVTKTTAPTKADKKVAKKVAKKVVKKTAKKTTKKTTTKTK